MHVEALLGSLIYFVGLLHTARVLAEVLLSFSRILRRQAMSLVTPARDWLEELRAWRNDLRLR
jgi:hypothetical protein